MRRIEQGELCKVLAAHKEWLDSYEREGERADLRSADLRGANLDFSCLPLWCGSLEVEIDAWIAAQLMYHIMRAMQSVNGDADVDAVLANEDCIRLANRFHRVDECGWIEKPTAKKWSKE